MFNEFAVTHQAGFVFKRTGGQTPCAKIMIVYSAWCLVGQFFIYEGVVNPVEIDVTFLLKILNV